MKKIAVFCSSSQHIDPAYTAEANIIGTWIGSRQCKLIYGGSARGLMEVVAQSTHESGGQVYGIIPHKFSDMGMTSRYADETIVTIDMHDRKRKMLEESDAIIILPGGAGTIDEFFDAYISRKLGYIQAPIIVCNTGGFFNPLLAQLERCYAERFASPLEIGLYQVADNAEHCCRMLNQLFSTLKPTTNEKK